MLVKYSQLQARTLVKYAHSRCAYGSAKLVKCRAATCQILGAVTGQIQKAVTGQAQSRLGTSHSRRWSKTQPPRLFDHQSAPGPRVGAAPFGRRTRALHWSKRALHLSKGRFTGQKGRFTGQKGRFTGQKGASLVKKGASLVKKGADGSRGATRSDTAPRRYTLVKRFTGQKGRQKRSKRAPTEAAGRRGQTQPQEEKHSCRGPAPAFII